MIPNKHRARGINVWQGAELSVGASSRRSFWRETLSADAESSGIQFLVSLFHGRPPGGCGGTAVPSLLSIFASVALLFAAPAPKSDRALELFNRGEFSGAARLFAKQHREGTLAPAHLLCYGQALARLGRFPEALPILDRYARLFPQDAVGWYELGYCRFAVGDFSGAAGSLMKAIDINPQQPKALKLLGRIQVAMGLLFEAEESFSTAVHEQPEDAEAHYLLGRLYQSTGQVGAAAEHLQKSVQLDPRNPRARAYLGHALSGLGQTDAAELQLREATRLARKTSPPDWAPFLELGIFLQRMGRVEEAIEPLETAVRLAPQEPEARFELGRALYRLGKPAESRRPLEEALRLSPGDARFHYLLSRVCFETGDSSCGEEHAELAEGGETAQGGGAKLEP